MRLVVRSKDCAIATCDLIWCCFTSGRTRGRCALYVSDRTPSFSAEQPTSHPHRVRPQLAHGAAGAPGIGDDVALGPWIGWINEILMQAGDPGSALAPLDVAARRAVKAYRACRNAAAAASQAAEEQSSAAPLSSTTEE